MSDLRGKDEIAELVKLGKIRNRLLAAKTMKSELRLAAERVMRLSEPGKPERFFTLVEVANELGVSPGEITDEILRLKREA